jgi:CelD/BcsL family acetyltransferase involved in cellulose biosynthesis
MNANPQAVRWDVVGRAEPRVSVMPRGVQVTEIDDAAGLAELARPWNDLLARSAAASPFLSSEWLISWWTHLRGRTRLSVRCVHRDGVLIGLAPFAVFPSDPRAGRPTRTLRFLGTGLAGSDYLDVLVRPEEEAVVLDEIAASIARDRIPLVLGPLRVRPCAAMGLVWRLEARGWRVRAARWSICPVADLAGGTWDDYLARLGSEHRYAVRRATRALESRFRVRYESVTSEARRRQVLGILATLHERRWRPRQSETAFGTPALRNFHDEASRRLLAKGALRLALLSVDGWPVAAIYGIRDRGAVHFYQSGFDPAFGKHGVGVVAMASSIRAAIAEGAAEYDFLHGAERYKFHWARKIRRLREVELYPDGGYFGFARGAGAVIRDGKRIARRWARA